MNKIFILLFVACLSYGGVPKFNHTKSFTLKKDEKAFVYLRQNGEENFDIFEFSWTLYDGTNLVVHSKFRRYPRQIMLSLRRGLELYKQMILSPLAKEFSDGVWLYLEFNKFEKNNALLSVYILDPAGRVEAKFEPDQGEQNARN